MELVWCSCPRTNLARSRSSHRRLPALPLSVRLGHVAVCRTSARQEQTFPIRCAVRGDLFGCANWFGARLFNNTATYKQKRALANEAFFWPPKAEKRELLQELMGPPQERALRPVAAHAKFQLGRQRGSSLAGAYWLMGHLPEDGCSVPN